ncbi:unnamed protein product, partial [Allacma fusca]
ILIVVDAEELTGKSEDAAAGNSNKTKGSDNGSSCRKLVLILAKRMLKVLTSCTKALKAQHPGSDFGEYFQCAIKCFMNKVEMSDKNHMLNNETFAIFAVKHIPENYHPMLYQVLGPCLATWGPKIDPSDEKCISYGEIIKCLQDQASS